MPGSAGRIRARHVRFPWLLLMDPLGVPWRALGVPLILLWCPSHPIFVYPLMSTLATGHADSQRAPKGDPPRRRPGSAPGTRKLPCSSPCSSVGGGSLRVPTARHNPCRTARQPPRFQPSLPQRPTAPLRRQPLYRSIPLSAPNHTQAWAIQRYGIRTRCTRRPRNKAPPSLHSSLILATTLPPTAGFGPVLY